MFPWVFEWAEQDNNQGNFVPTSQNFHDPTDIIAEAAVTSNLIKVEPSLEDPAIKKIKWTSNPLILA